MKVCVIGGTGHIGRFLTPGLVRDGHQVTLITKGETKQTADPEWTQVNAVQAVYERGDGFRDLMKDLDIDVLIDIIGNDVPTLYDNAKHRIEHIILCGSIWMFGAAKTVPTPDDTQTPCPFEGYDTRYEQMQQTRDRAKADGIAFSAIMPPNICGPGKIPLDLLGGRGLEVHKSHQRGEPVPLPHGCNTLIGPCDAEDIAAAFRLAVQKREQADGEIFNVGSAYALTAPELVGTFGDIYGTKIPIDWVSYEKYTTESVPEFGANFHFLQHMCPDITKLRTKLGYDPVQTPESTLERAVKWMFDEGLLT
jgi:nucleoside-diphosphate-sugar epimerase